MKDLLRIFMFAALVHIVLMGIAYVIYNGLEAERQRPPEPDQGARIIE